MSARQSSRRSTRISEKRKDDLRQALVVHVGSICRDIPFWRDGPYYKRILFEPLLNGAREAYYVLGLSDFAVNQLMDIFRQALDLAIEDCSPQKKYEREPIAPTTIRPATKVEIERYFPETTT
jgi:hypothetical protein